jgi:Flp pilus assembly protein TadG
MPGHRRHGTTATEFAIVLPLLIVLCLTSVDFGRCCYALIALGNAARVGSEYSATHRYDAASSETWRSNLEYAMCEEFAAIGGLDPDDLTVDIQVEIEDYQLHRGSITARYPFSTVVSWPMIPRPLELERTVVMRRFR